MLFCGIKVLFFYCTGQENNLKEGAQQAAAMGLPCASTLEIPALDSPDLAGMKVETIPELQKIDSKALLELSTVLADNLREIKVT